MDTGVVLQHSELDTFARQPLTQIRARSKVIHRVMRQKRSDLTEIKCMEMSVNSEKINQFPQAGY